MKDTIIMTLDAGGTNLVFSAFCEGEEVVQPRRRGGATLYAPGFER